ncbi:hypothetical protein RHSIM_Rhsim08G0227000 [Rhododendron simsii]|uniref:SAWADEE domain-containing protein n=1 Tax=Rhododendron simsii TaxID=118357 RepID=A0A834GK10_RHOSS|nr:hypothetical protein RHSIM_Rhsim08G0227000 [Rhododendron simsii]
MESLKDEVIPSDPSAVAPEDPPLDFSIPNNAPESHQKPKVESVPGLSDLVFEAKSSKDGACLKTEEGQWQLELLDLLFKYVKIVKGEAASPVGGPLQVDQDFAVSVYDVASFLNHRFLRTGELEVRVRFAGFRKEDDEWVNVERGVRERSIPLEPSECDRVNVGDLVLCFRETDEEATYCDAHIVSIQRRLHDIRGCRCIFVVRYDDDEVEVCPNAKILGKSSVDYLVLQAKMMDLPALFGSKIIFCTVLYIVCYYFS